MQLNKTNTEVAPVARKAIRKLLNYLSGLGFWCSNEETTNLEAQRQLTKWITKNFLLVIWTVVEGSRIIPPKEKKRKEKKMMRFILLASRINGNNEVIWKLSRVFPYGNKQTFPNRFRRQAELLIALANSARQCQHHAQSLTLITKGRELYWTCTKGGCETKFKVGQDFANLLYRHTPKNYWRSKQL